MYCIFKISIFFRFTEIEADWYAVRGAILLYLRFQIKKVHLYAIILSEKHLLQTIAFLLLVDRIAALQSKFHPMTGRIRLVLWRYGMTVHNVYNCLHSPSITVSKEHFQHTNTYLQPPATCTNLSLRGMALSSWKLFFLRSTPEIWWGVVFKYNSVCWIQPACPSQWWHPWRSLKRNPGSTWPPADWG